MQRRTIKITAEVQRQIINAVKARMPDVIEDNDTDLIINAGNKHAFMLLNSRNKIEILHPRKTDNNYIMFSYATYFNISSIDVVVDEICKCANDFVKFAAECTEANLLEEVNSI